MKKNKILLGLAFLFFSMCFCLSGSAGKEDERGDALSKISKQEFYLKKQSISINSLEKNRIDDTPSEVLYEICYRLSPMDIVHLSMTFKDFKEKVTNIFWESYLKVRNHKKWDQSTPIIRVAFAYSLFEEGKIENSATFGFPEAIKILNRKENSFEKMEKKSRKNKIKSYLKRGFLQNNYYSMLAIPVSPVFPVYLGYQVYNKPKSW